MTTAITNSGNILMAFVAILGGISGISLLVCSYPPKPFVRVMHKNNILLEEYYFYCQKSTAYRMLFLFHSIFLHAVKFIGTTMTLITVYCAVDQNEQVLLYAMLAAICDILSLIVPSEKYMKIYAQAARMLEFKLYAPYDNKEIMKKEIINAYEEAEELIARDFA